MRDRYFFRSLVYTLIVYFILAGALIAFVVIAGIAGFLIILIGVVFMLSYFYKGAGLP
jgi:hypothetical protein